MDTHLRGLLRRFTYTQDPADAIAFTNSVIRAHGDPNKKSNDFYAAWWWLHEHPSFFHLNGNPGFFDGLDMSVQKVNPMTGVIDDDKSLNTQVEIWLEAGPWLPLEEDEPDVYGTGEMPSHDYELDCGALTYEDALLKMAKLVKKHYGDYESFLGELPF